MSDLRDVNHKLFDVRVKWKILGLELHLDPGTLDAVENKCRENPDGCLMEVLKKWIGKGGASWKQLVTALRIKTVGETGLCDMIEKEYCQQEESEIDDLMVDTVPCKPSTLLTPNSLSLDVSQSDRCFNSYINRLKVEYSKQMVPSEGLLKSQNKICRLAMIKNEESYFHDSRDEYIRQTITGKVSNILQSRTPVELKDILNVDISRQVVLIEGAPGAGKSSLSLDICKKWSEGKFFEEYKVVILVRLRDPKVQEAKQMFQLLPYCEEPKQIESTIKAIEGRNVLWVLDGWDELPDNLKHEKSLLHKMIYLPNHNSAIVVTSRPVSSVKLHSIVSKRFKILGFTPEDLKEFFINRLDDSKSVDTLLDKIKDYPEVESSCYLPLHAAIVADTFMLEKQSFPTTQYGIFESVVIKCISRYQSKLGKPEIQSLEELPDDIKPNFESVCKLAYRGILENRVIFTNEYLPSHLDFNGLDLLQEVESMLAFEEDSCKTYNFLHLSIEEFLAAHHLANKESYEQIWIFSGLMDIRCLPMLTFYAAKSKLSAFENTDFFSSILEDVLEFQDKFQRAKGTGSLLFAFQCICEAEQPSICQPLAKALNGKYFSAFRGLWLSLLNYYSIGSFLALSSTTDIGSVIEVDIAAQHFRVEGFIMLMKGMLKCSLNNPIVSPLSVNFLSCIKRVDEIDSVVTVLKHTKLFHTLRFELLSPNMCTVLIKGVEHNFSLHTLEIIVSDEFIDSDLGFSFEQMLAINSTLQLLNVTGNVVNSITRGLQYNSTLRELTISEKQHKDFEQTVTESNSENSMANNLQEIDSTPFCTALSVNKSLQSLRISTFNGGSISGYDIVCGLEVHTSLEELDLSEFDITAKEGDVLCKVLAANNNSLRCLNLSSCKLNAEAVVKIFNSIKQNIILKDLNLSDCGIHLQMCNALQDALVSNKTLEVLNLNSNRLSDDCTLSLSQGLERNNTLRELHIEDCGISNIGTDYILRVLVAERVKQHYLFFPPTDLDNSQPLAKRGKISCDIFLNYFERIVTSEDRQMMIKSISFTLLSPQGEYNLMEWLHQGPSIECLYIAYKEQPSSHCSNQRYYTINFHTGYENQLYFNCTSIFFEALKQCKHMKTLHINTPNIENPTWSSFANFLAENNSLTKVYLECKYDKSGYDFDYHFSIFVSCLEKNTSLEELTLSGLNLSYNFDRKDIQDRINIGRKKIGKPEFTFFEPLEPIDMDFDLLK